MRRSIPSRKTFGIGPLGVALLAACLLSTGCEDKPLPSKPAPTDPPIASGQTNGDAQNGGAADYHEPETITIDDTPAEPAPAVLPQVLMTEADRKTCLVGVGDTFPTGEVADLQGPTTPLSAIYGPKATVVVFWGLGPSSYSQLAAKSLLQDLQFDVVEPYANKGVSVVAANIGDQGAAVAGAIADWELAYPVVSDPGAQLWRKVAVAETLPRVFVLDAQGRIAWFDIEYSQTTREEMINAVRFLVEN